MEQALRREAVEVEDEWAGHPRADRAVFACAQNAATESRMLPDNHAIKKLAQNAAQ